MGHCLIGRNVEKLGVLSNDFCRGCVSEEERETRRKLVAFRDCFDTLFPVLTLKSQRLLSFHFPSRLTELAYIKIDAITKFILETGWFPLGTF